MTAAVVLVVEDEVGLTELTADLLRDAGFDVSVAANGKLGLASLAARRADLVIVDLNMPVMSGLEMIRHLRADPSLANIPTILVTAAPESIPTGADALHDVALVKPFTLAELLHTMNRLLGRA